MSGSLSLPPHTPPPATRLIGQGRGHLSLPPKPPQTRELPETHRDHRKKRKQEKKKNRHRDNRNKNNSNNSRSSNQKPQDSTGRSRSKGGSDRKATGSPHTQERALPDSISNPAATTVSPVKSKESPAAENKDASVKELTKDATPPTTELVEDGEWEWEKVQIFKENKPQSSPDEVDRPLPAGWSEEIVLPRKPDASCIHSDYVKADNLDEFLKPLHETDYWVIIEFDPAFVRDGRLPCGDPLPKSSALDDPLHKDKNSGGHQRKHECSDEELDYRENKRRRTNSPSNSQQEDGLHDLTESLLEAHNSAQGKADNHGALDGDKAGISEAPGLPLMKQRDSQAPDRRGSPDSRRSSVSRASSDLNSLEAELLGRSSKAKTPEETEYSKRRDSDSNSRFKRRQPKLDSAYR